MFCAARRLFSDICLSRKHCPRWQLVPLRGVKPPQPLLLPSQAPDPVARLFSEVRLPSFLKASQRSFVARRFACSCHALVGTGFRHGNSPQLSSKLLDVIYASCSYAS